MTRTVKALYAIPLAGWVVLIVGVAVCVVALVWAVVMREND